MFVDDLSAIYPIIRNKDNLTTLFYCILISFFILERRYLSCCAVPSGYSYFSRDLVLFQLIDSIAKTFIGTNAYMAVSTRFISEVINSVGNCC